MLFFSVHFMFCWIHDQFGWSWQTIGGLWFFDSGKRADSLVLCSCMGNSLFTPSLDISCFAHLISRGCLGFTPIFWPIPHARPRYSPTHDPLLNWGPIVGRPNDAPLWRAGFRTNRSPLRDQVARILRVRIFTLQDCPSTSNRRTSNDFSLNVAASSHLAYFSTPHPV